MNLTESTESAEKEAGSELPRTISTSSRRSLFESSVYKQIVRVPGIDGPFTRAYFRNPVQA